MALRGLLSSLFAFVLASWFALDAKSPLRAAADGGDSSPPLNVLLILVDDLGWADPGCYGADLHDTPNIGGTFRGAPPTFHYPHYYFQPPTEPVSALRSGRWKLREHLTDGRLELFGIGETTDLSRQRAEKAAELCASLHAWREQVGARMPVWNR